MAEFRYEMRIPKERIAVLIGKDGEIKKMIEEFSNIVMLVDSKEGDVIVEGKDPLTLYTSRDMIRAIGRGFNPEIAKLLLKQDYALEVIPLKDYVKDSQVERVRGRIIGAGGKSRRVIEDLTESYICVFGNTVSIIGTHENIMNAKKAVDMIITGSPHNSVYRWLEKKRRDQRGQQAIGPEDFK